MADFSGMKLGKLAPRAPRDSNRVLLKAYMPMALPPPPEESDWTCGETTRPMFGNDSIGDCTCAAIANTIVGAMRAQYQDTWVPSTEDVVWLYSQITGYTPADPNSDTGAVVEDVVSYVLKNGAFGHHFVATAAVGTHDLDNIKRSIDWFGNIDLGILLPRAWQNTHEWGTGPNVQGAWAAGSWGGHCVTAAKYDATHLYVWTWGQLMPVTWAAFQTYADTADVILSASWIKAGKSPHGVDLTELKKDMEYF